MRLFKLLLLLSFVYGCKSEIKKEIKDSIKNDSEVMSIVHQFDGNFTELNKEKVRLEKSKYWLEITIDEVILNPIKGKKTIIKKDEYSKGVEYQNYDISLLVTIKNINDQYIEFDNEAFRNLNIWTEIKDVIYPPQACDFDMHWSKTKNYSFESNESKQYTLEFRGKVIETMDPLYLDGFLTKGKNNINYKVAFKIDFKSKSIIDKSFREVTNEITIEVLEEADKN